MNTTLIILAIILHFLIAYKSYWSGYVIGFKTGKTFKS